MATWMRRIAMACCGRTAMTMLACAFASPGCIVVWIVLLALLGAVETAAGWVPPWDVVALSEASTAVIVSLPDQSQFQAGGDAVAHASVLFGVLAVAAVALACCAGAAAGVQPSHAMSLLGADAAALVLIASGVGLALVRGLIAAILVVLRPVVRGRHMYVLRFFSSAFDYLDHSVGQQAGMAWVVQRLPLPVGVARLGHDGALVAAGRTIGQYWLGGEQFAIGFRDGFMRAVAEWGFGGGGVFVFEEEGEMDDGEMAVNGEAADVAVDRDAADVAVNGEAADVAVDGEAADVAVDGDAADVAVNGEAADVAVNGEAADVAVNGEAADVAVDGDAADVAVDGDAADVAVDGEAITGHTPRPGTPDALPPVEPQPPPVTPSTAPSGVSRAGRFMDTVHSLPHSPVRSLLLSSTRPESVAADVLNRFSPLHMAVAQMQAASPSLRTMSVSPTRLNWAAEDVPSRQASAQSESSGTSTDAPLDTDTADDDEPPDVDGVDEEVLADATGADEPPDVDGVDEEVPADATGADEPPDVDGVDEEVPADATGADEPPDVDGVDEEVPADAADVSSTAADDPYPRALPGRAPSVVASPDWSFLSAAFLGVGFVVVLCACIVLTGLFWYHWEGQAMGKLALDSLAKNVMPSLKQPFEDITGLAFARKVRLGELTPAWVTGIPPRVWHEVSVDLQSPDKGGTVPADILWAVTLRFLAREHQQGNTEWSVRHPAFVPVVDQETQTLLFAQIPWAKVLQSEQDLVWQGQLSPLAAQLTSPASPSPSSPTPGPSFAPSVRSRLMQRLYRDPSNVTTPSPSPVSTAPARAAVWERPSLVRSVFARHKALPPWSTSPSGRRGGTDDWSALVGGFASWKELHSVAQNVVNMSVLVWPMAREDLMQVTLSAPTIRKIVLNTTHCVNRYLPPSSAESSLRVRTQCNPIASDISELPWWLLLSPPTTQPPDDSSRSRFCSSRVVLLSNRGSLGPCNGSGLLEHPHGWGTNKAARVLESGSNDTDASSLRFVSRDSLQSLLERTDVSTALLGPFTPLVQVAREDPLPEVDEEDLISNPMEFAIRSLLEELGSMDQVIDSPIGFSAVVMGQRTKKQHDRNRFPSAGMLMSSLATSENALARLALSRTYFPNLTVAKAAENESAASHGLGLLHEAMASTAIMYPFQHRLLSNLWERHALQALQEEVSLGLRVALVDVVRNGWDWEHSLFNAILPKWSPQHHAIGDAWNATWVHLEELVERGVVVASDVIRTIHSLSKHSSVYWIQQATLQLCDLSLLDWFLPPLQSAQLHDLLQQIQHDTPTQATPTATPSHAPHVEEPVTPPPVVDADASGIDAVLLGVCAHVGCFTASTAHVLPPLATQVSVTGDPILHNRSLGAPLTRTVLLARGGDPEVTEHGAAPMLQLWSTSFQSKTVSLQAGAKGEGSLQDVAEGGSWRNGSRLLPFFVDVDPTVPIIPPKSLAVLGLAYEAYWAVLIAATALSFAGALSLVRCVSEAAIKRSLSLVRRAVRAYRRLKLSCQRTDAPVAHMNGFPPIHRTCCDTVVDAWELSAGVLAAIVRPLLVVLGFWALLALLMEILAQVATGNNVGPIGLSWGMWAAVIVTVGLVLNIALLDLLSVSIDLCSTAACCFRSTTWVLFARPRVVPATDPPAAPAVRAAPEAAEPEAQVLQMQDDPLEWNPVADAAAAWEGDDQDLDVEPPVLDDARVGQAAQWLLIARTWRATPYRYFACGCTAVAGRLLFTVLEMLLGGMSLLFQGLLVLICLVPIAGSPSLRLLLGSGMEPQFSVPAMLFLYGYISSLTVRVLCLHLATYSGVESPLGAALQALGATGSDVLANHIRMFLCPHMANPPGRPGFLRFFFAANPRRPQARNPEVQPPPPPAPDAGDIQPPAEQDGHPPAVEPEAADPPRSVLVWRRCMPRSPLVCSLARRGAQGLLCRMCRLDKHAASMTACSIRSLLYCAVAVGVTIIPMAMVRPIVPDSISPILGTRLPPVTTHPSRGVATDSAAYYQTQQDPKTAWEAPSSPSGVHAAALVMELTSHFALFHGGIPMLVGKEALQRLVAAVSISTMFLAALIFRDWDLLRVSQAELMEQTVRAWEAVAGPLPADPPIGDIRAPEAPRAPAEEQPLPVDPPPPLGCWHRWVGIRSTLRLWAITDGKWLVSTVEAWQETVDAAMFLVTLLLRLTVALLAMLIAGSGIVGLFLAASVPIVFLFSLAIRSFLPQPAVQAVGQHLLFIAAGVIVLMLVPYITRGVFALVRYCSNLNEEPQDRAPTVWTGLLALGHVLAVTRDAALGLVMWVVVIPLGMGLVARSFVLPVLRMAFAPTTDVMRMYIPLASSDVPWLLQWAVGVIFLTVFLVGSSLLADPQTPQLLLPHRPDPLPFPAAIRVWANSLISHSHEDATMGLQAARIWLLARRARTDIQTFPLGISGIKALALCKEAWAEFDIGLAMRHFMQGGLEATVNLIVLVGPPLIFQDCLVSGSACPIPISAYSFHPEVESLLISWAAVAWAAVVLAIVLVRPLVLVKLSAF
jgi:hypothetical protein